ncbi:MULTISPECIES: hypothetical protein [Streptomyces]|uniref:Peptidase inhibitor family I36 protein n=3 Tax=Streptomyces TaxID=1883 RepID=A0A3Q9FYM9_STRLT|nr:hypothetical protein [Streptomyces luteoverticillatus]AZQ74885.1 hypothetical protein EKH77_30095 [Streptomyces luteoverticillatus]
MRTSHRAALAAAVAFAGLSAAIVPTNSAADTRSAFTDQAVRAGLTAAQADGLRQRVDAYVDATGGRRIALNKIAVKGGTILVTVPGETYARELNGVLDRTAVAASCPYLYFCGWKGANRSGDQWNVSDCGVQQEIPDGWNSGGSWQNNQSSGTRARMYNKNHGLIYTTPPAPYGPVNGDWGPVWYVRAC